MNDLSVRVEDSAVNAVIAYLRKQAPFLFNYVSPTVKEIKDDSGQTMGWEEVWLVCHEVQASLVPGLPRYRRLPPLTLPWMPLRMPYCLQVTQLAVDFHPSDAVALPPEAGPALEAQQFALELGLSFGFACIPQDVVAHLGQRPARKIFWRDVPVLPVTSLICSELRVVAVGHLVTTRTTPVTGAPQDTVRLAVDRLEIVDMAPQGLEDALECYLRAMLVAHVLPHLVLALKPFALGLLDVSSVAAWFSDPAPNPAVEDHELRVRLDIALT